ncbi:putative ribonuclease H protein [Hibiscus syriacus]|uniref:Ribonuclease H protein n=1 Tax=Hibiscus syriacus TaxID=106335 RepID=A0A6A3CG35_HIBSY|nr:putative ribonuclease H protein [Hibiscus syriacus]
MAKVPYANTVGSLMYAMVCTRPDISQAVGVVSRYMHDPGEGHWQAVKWILRYLRQTVDVGLVFEQDEALGQCVVGYADSDYAGDLDKRRSTTGYLFTLAKAPVSWKFTLQSTVALSTTEAEYMAVSEAVKEAIWLNGLMEDLGVVQSHISLYCDSQSAIHLAKNQVYHSRTKHIDVKYHFVREIFEERKILLQKIATSENPADMMTKMRHYKFGELKKLSRLGNFKPRWRFVRFGLKLSWQVRNFILVGGQLIGNFILVGGQTLNMRISYLVANLYTLKILCEVIIRCGVRGVDDILVEPRKFAFGGFDLDILDQELQALVVSEILVEDASIKNAKPSADTDSNINQTCKDLCGYISEDVQDTYYDEFNNSRRNESSIDECIPVKKIVKDSGLSFSNFNRELDFTCLPSSCSSQSIADKDLDIGLKLELDAVDAQYQQWFQELSSRRDEELEATKKRWMAKKNLAVK